MKSPFGETLAALVRQRGVAGSMVVSEADGIIVDATVAIGVDAPVFAALAASLYRKARLAAHAAGLGEAAFLQLEAERGRVCAVGRGDLVLVTIAESRANVGLIRMEMLKALEALG
jgi:predicted regulator of Ras-like GTPase activity (Roadblock/LC7/MglB family)